MNPVGIAAGPGCTHREDLTSYSMYAQGLAVHNWNSCRVALPAKSPAGSVTVQLTMRHHLQLRGIFYKQQRQ